MSDKKEVSVRRRVVLLVFGAVALTPPIRMAMMLHKQNQPKSEADDEHD